LLQRLGVRLWRCGSTASDALLENLLMHRVLSAHSPSPRVFLVLAVAMPAAGLPLTMLVFTMLVFTMLVFTMLVFTRLLAAVTIVVLTSTRLAFAVIVWVLRLWHDCLLWTTVGASTVCSGSNGGRDIACCWSGWYIASAMREAA